MKRIAIVAEDNGHVRVITKLVDDVLVSNVDWLDGILDSSRRWCGSRDDERWYKYVPEDANDLRPLSIDGVTIKLQGWINGERLKPEASMWRRALLLLGHARPRPDAVVLVRDLCSASAVHRTGCPEFLDEVEQRLVPVFR